MKKEITFTIDPKNFLKNIKVLSNGKYQFTLLVDEDTLENKKDSYDLQNFRELIKKSEINLKDLREVIMLAHSYWEVRDLDADASDKTVIEYYKVNKDNKDTKENIYSEELIILSLSALSTSNDYVADFYERLEKVNPSEHTTFESFFKKMYKNDIDK